MSLASITQTAGVGRPSAPGDHAPKYPFLDGLRGLAALYVVIHHEAQIYMGERCEPAPAYFRAYPYMILGNYAVVVAIVLSGFCLMLSVIRSADGSLRGGLGAYVWRRVRRLVPAFYAAIAISYLLVWLVPALHRHDGELWGFAFGSDDWRSFFEWKTLVAHLFLVHAVRQDWIMRIDPPMWSVGVEWINLFLMPMLLLPVWRRAGGAALMLFATVICFAPFLTMRFTHDDRYTFQWAQPWLVAMFAYGMATAALVFPKHTPDRFRGVDRLVLRVALHPATLLLLAAGLYVSGKERRVPMTFLIGSITVCIVLHGMTGTKLGRLMSRPLESRFALWLGTTSYSLYLLHTPFQMLLQRAMEPFHFAPAVRFSLLLIVGSPLMMLVGAIGYRCFERPFMGRRG